MSTTSSTDSLLRMLYRYRTSQRVAYIHDTRQLTYQQLYDQAERIAARLAYLHAGPVVLIGEKEPEMLVGMIASLIAGLPYVPLSSDWPARRQHEVLSQLESHFKGSPILLSPSLISFWGEQSDTSIPQGYQMNFWSPCMYVLFTSGSTGTPKGFGISRDNIWDFVKWVHAEFHPENEVWINQSPFFFDLSDLDIWGGLTSGSTIVGLSSADIKDPSRLMTLLGELSPTVWVSTPTFLQYCLAHPLFDAALVPRLRLILQCGEIFPASTYRKASMRFPSTEIYNLYGPAETTCCVTSCKLNAQHLELPFGLPIGSARPGTTLTINPRGDCRISGRSVGMGYLDPSLPGFGFQDGCRYFDSGDHLLLISGDNPVDPKNDVWLFLGRTDSQVKIAGRRIDLREIQSRLERMTQVRAARVRCDAHQRIVADLWIDPSCGGEIIDAELRQYLPAYMIPYRYRLFESITTGPTGKCLWDMSTPYMEVRPLHNNV